MAYVQGSEGRPVLPREVPPEATIAGLTRASAPRECVTKGPANPDCTLHIGPTGVFVHHLASYWALTTALTSACLVISRPRGGTQQGEGVIPTP